MFFKAEELEFNIWLSHKQEEESRQESLDKALDARCQELLKEKIADGSIKQEGENEPGPLVSLSTFFED